MTNTQSNDTSDAHTTAVNSEEFDDILAAEMGMDVQKLREESDSIELGDPREAEVVDE